MIYITVKIYNNCIIFKKVFSLVWFHLILGSICFGCIHVVNDKAAFIFIIQVNLKLVL